MNCGESSGFKLLAVFVMTVSLLIAGSFVTGTGVGGLMASGTGGGDSGCGMIIFSAGFGSVCTGGETMAGAGFGTVLCRFK